jgi:hypothetical protein
MKHGEIMIKDDSFFVKNLKDFPLVHPTKFSYRKNLTRCSKSALQYYCVFTLCISKILLLFIVIHVDVLNGYIVHIYVFVYKYVWRNMAVRVKWCYFTITKLNLCGIVKVKYIFFLATLTNNFHL